jgi:SpoIID/LytB domain protein
VGEVSRVRPLTLVALPVLLAGLVCGVGRGTARGATEPLPRVSFISAPGSSVLLHGIYPKVDSPCVKPVQPLLHSRFPGTVEIGRDTDGSLFVIGVLTFEQYLEGIAEVPRTWPIAALKAQVVAARSYALAHMAYPDSTGDRLGYDLCATTACQVYAGMRVGAGPYGDRWRRAVDETAGKVLLYKGKPADTLYFSTSNGSTIGNDKVFGTDPLPYLRPVVERDDGASPLSHWQATLPHPDVGRFLKAAGVWGGENVTSVSLSGSNVVVKGGGRTETLSVTDFRSHLDYWGPCLDPAHYPTGDLPQTVPSKWFTTANAGGAVVLNGRGWGHGVGMVQYGAYGKALRGLSYSDILAAYYGGLRPKPYAEPSIIRIGIATGLQSVTVVPTGEVTMTGAAPVSSPWLVSARKHLRVRPGDNPPKYISRGKLLQAPTQAKVGHTLTAKVSVPDLLVAKLVFRVPGQLDADVGTGTTISPGTATLSGIVPDLPPGTYRLQAELTNGTDIVRAGSHMVHVTGGTTPAPSVSPSVAPTRPPLTTGPVALGPTGSSRVRALLTIVVAGVFLLGLGSLLLLRRRRAKMHPPAS